MTTDPRSIDDHPSLSPDSAFVVHLLATDAPDVVCGRAEHIVSGQWTRFTSVAELLRFMRETVAIAAD